VEGWCFRSCGATPWCGRWKLNLSTVANSSGAPDDDGKAKGSTSSAGHNACTTVLIEDVPVHMTVITCSRMGRTAAAPTTKSPHNIEADCRKPSGTS
jgi:hypothetical protein